MQNDSPYQESASESWTLKIKKPKGFSAKLIISIIGVLVVAGLVFYYKSLFVVAMVRGRPISRFSIIRELEKTSGKRVLESMITERLIHDEAKKKGVMITAEDVETEIKNIETQLAGRGATLDAALAGQGMTKDDLKKQITTQKKVEKLLAEKIQVSEDDIKKFIEDNKMTIPEGKDQETHDQVRDQLKQQKLNQEVKTWLDNLRTEAHIRYFLNY